MKPIGRRDFLKKASHSCCALLMADIIRPFAGELAHASAVCGASNNRILLHIIQAGGNDAANTLVPADRALFPSYYSKRPTLAINNSLLLPGLAQYGLHPSMPKLYEMYKQGLLALIPKVGYPNQVSSHADATRNFARARFESLADSTGWAGRMADALNECGQTTDFTLLSFGGPVRDVNAASYTALTATGLTGLDEAQDTYRQWDKSILAKISDELEQADRPLTDAAKRRVAARNKFKNSAAALKAASAYSPAGYPTTTLGSRLKDFARIVKYNLPGLKYVVVPHGGYDTHERQLVNHAARLADLDSSIGALVADLKSMGKLGQVLILVESEFSRRLYQSAPSGGAPQDAGTDHGGAILAMMISASLRGGVYGPGYANNDFEGANFEFAVDFRELRKRAVSWLGIDPGLVFPERFTEAGVAANILPGA